MNNTDKVVDYLLKNVGKLSPEKIDSISKVIRSLWNEKIREPNKIKDDELPGEPISENNPIDILKAQAVQVEGMPKRKVKIYETK